MALPPRDPLQPPSRATRLPDVRGARLPAGYQAGFRWGERLAGLALIGIGGLSAAFALLVLEPTSPLGNPLGLRPLGLPWLVPILLLGAAGLVLLGLRRLLAP